MHCTFTWFGLAWFKILLFKVKETDWGKEQYKKKDNKVLDALYGFMLYLFFSLGEIYGKNSPLSSFSSSTKTRSISIG